jgi:PAS domain S-box-containing protein
MTAVPSPGAARNARTPLLAQLRVGTKLMLLIVLPVCVLLLLTAFTAVGDWRAASKLQNFQSATRLSVVTAEAAERLAAERTAAVLELVQPTGQDRAGLTAAQRGVDQALHQAGQSAAAWNGTVDVQNRIAAASQQLTSLRLQSSAGTVPAQDISQSYSVIATDLIDIAGDLLASAPTQASERAANAYLAIMQSVEAAQSERADVAAVLATRGAIQPSVASQWATLESADLDAFRRNAPSSLTAGLNWLLISPAGISVQQLRQEFLNDPRLAVATTPLETWLATSGTRIGGLQQLERGEASDLAATVSQDLSAARTSGIRNVGVFVAVLAAVVTFALVLRRSITRPLREVSDAARTLSSGNLASGVSYAGRDEIGDVAAAFRDLNVTAERLAAEIRSMNAAISNNQLDHQADAGMFEGTWAQLLAGMNDTMAAFATVHSRRRRAERELEGIFNLSLDLLCIIGDDGYFKRVNPAFEQTLGYTSEELLSKPIIDFVHPDDRARTKNAHSDLISGNDVIRFENRYLCRDAGERWLQWSARPVPDEGLIYAAARDVTNSRRASEEEAALRRVATLVAKGVPPAEVFDAVVTEVRLLLRAANTRLLRYDPDGNVTVVASSSEPGAEISPDTGRSVSAAVWCTGRAARIDDFEGRPGAISPALRDLGLRSGAGAPVIVEGRIWGLTAAAWRRHRPPAGIESRMAQFTELVATAISNAQAQADLSASRARIVAASDETRRRIERDLHDGAQQRLVSLQLGLRMAQEDVPFDQAELKQELARTADGISGVLAELRELCRGIHPTALSEGGLQSALKVLARRSPVPVELDVRGQGRLPGQVEVAAYFVVSEALANAAKHAQASLVEVTVAVHDNTLKVTIRDDGVGGADPSRGSGLIGLADRVEALGGTIDVMSSAGVGTQILVCLPVGTDRMPSVL